MCDKKPGNGSESAKMADLQIIMRELFQHWCAVTTCAGVIDFSVARTCLGRIFWLIIVVGFLILTCMQTRNSVDDFLYGKPYETSLTEITGNPAVFPNVTVCNYNRVKNIEGYNLTRHALSYAYGATNLDYFTYFNRTFFTRLLEFEKDYKEMLQTYQLKGIKDLFKTFGYSCEETFVACQWNSLPFNCCEMATEVVGAEGRCWTVLYHHVNETGRLHQNFPGSNYGLKLLINPNLDMYNNEVLINNFLEKGFIVQAGYYKQIRITETTSLQPGSRAWIELRGSLYEYRISKHLFRKIPCRLNATIKYSNVAYTADNCFLDCWHKEIFGRVACVPLGPVREQFPICEPDQMFRFQTMYIDESERDFSNVLANVNECRKNCSFPCEGYYEMKTTLISRTFLERPIPTNLVHLTNEMFPHANMSKETLESLINVNVFFASLQYVLAVTSERTPIFSFISDVGGQLSLWLGISVITIIQLCYYICLCICCGFRKYPTKCF